MASNNERRMKTEQALSNAFFELYATMSIERITVNDIVTRAGYNRSTFYAYFQDVYEVLERTEKHLIQVVEKIGPDLLDSLVHGSADQELRVIVSLIKEHQSSFPTLIRKHDHGFVVTLRETVLRECRQRHPQLPVEELDILGQCLTYHFSALIGVMNYWFDKEGAIPIDTIFPFIKEVSTIGVFNKIASISHLSLPTLKPDEMIWGETSGFDASGRVF